jgi:K+-sensing histidine kinase KdpD
MRPIRVTGVTGTSAAVPLDVYAEGQQTVVDYQTAGAGVPQVTADNVFDSTITPTWHAAPTKDATTGLYFIPSGVRAVRMSGAVSADVMVVSQQGIV